MNHCLLRVIMVGIYSPGRMVVSKQYCEQTGYPKQCRRHNPCQNWPTSRHWVFKKDDLPSKKDLSSQLQEILWCTYILWILWIHLPVLCLPHRLQTDEENSTDYLLRTNYLTCQDKSVANLGVTVYIVPQQMYYFAQCKSSLTNTGKEYSIPQQMCNFANHKSLTNTGKEYSIPQQMCNFAHHKSDKYRERVKLFLNRCVTLLTISLTNTGKEYTIPQQMCNFAHHKSLTNTGKE